MIHFINISKALLTTSFLVSLIWQSNSQVSKGVAEGQFPQPAQNHKKNIAQLNERTADTSKRPWEDYISLKDYCSPFWKADTIFDESVQLIKNGANSTAGLLYGAKKILSVKAANYSRTFVEGRDWDYKNGRLVFGQKSTVPFFTAEQIFFNKEIPGRSVSGNVAGTFVLFSEGAYFSSMQILVTYVKNKSSKWSGPTPAFAATTLPNTLLKLKSKENLKIVFYGNSIEVGYNASGLEKVPPFMPVWPDLVAYNLKRKYGGPITCSNLSVIGKLAKWGQESVSTKVLPEKPNLVIIGFGMNDGSDKLAPEVYGAHIKGILDSVNKISPKTEFILISPMLANPLSSFSGTQALFKKELDKLKRKGVVVADITGAHIELLKHKSYQDMTGNNINHPNDYLARWYAHVISGILIE